MGTLAHATRLLPADLGLERLEGSDVGVRSVEADARGTDELGRSVHRAQRQVGATVPEVETVAVTQDTSVCGTEMSCRRAPSCCS